MALTQAPKALGTHAFFFENGTAYTVPTAGTCARESKPGAADPAWIDLGVIDDAMDTPVAGTDIEIWAPNPGRRVLDDVIVVGDKLVKKFTCKELSAICIQALYRTLALTSASTQFNQLSGVPLKGWLKLQRYDQSDTLTILEEVFVLLKATGDVDMSGGKLAEVGFEATVLRSTLNTGTL